MLTREEQTQIVRRADALVRASLTLASARRSVLYPVSTKAAAQQVQRKRVELLDYLKEVG